MINLSTQNIKIATLLLSFFLFSLFLPQKATATVYNCYSATGNANSKCIDLGGGTEFSIPYYTCDGGGGCKGQAILYNVACTFLGYGGDGGHQCQQEPTPPNGYTNYSACASACKCTGGDQTCVTRYLCNLNTGYCDDGSFPRKSCSSINDCPCKVWNTSPVICPGHDSGPAVGAAICCSGTGSGEGCTPTCPTPKCTVTDAMCATANGGDTGYKAVSTGDCKGNDAYCLQDNGCWGQNTCNTSTCYKQGTCQDCTETCNAGERLDPTTCTPRAASCTKINSCTGKGCGDTDYYCYPIGTCQNCTPIPPSGYHLPAEGETTICPTATATCKKTTTCGVECDDQTATAYQDEPNTTPNPPQDLQITIDEVNSGNLSTLASSPTLIKYPYPSSATSTSIRNVTPAPVGSRAFGWELRIGSTLITPRKVFNTTPPFNVYGPYPSLSSLNQGYNGAYHARYYTLNKCDNTEKYSTSLDGYFRVNSLPVSTATIVGEANPEHKGCVPVERYTGQNVNRTLTITVSGSDIDITNSINGAILWLVKDGSNITNEKELMTFIGPGNARVDMNKIGLFINSGGTVYISNNSSGTLTGWGRNGLDGGAIPHPVKNGEGVTIIDNVQLVEQRMNLVTGKYEYKITLTFPQNSPLTGHYTLYTGMTDTLSYIQDSLGRTSIDQRRVSSAGPDWNFDFVSPEVTNTNTDVDNNTRILTLSWDSSDDLSGIRDSYTIVNAYKDSDPKPITWLKGPFIPPENIAAPTQAPQARYIGDYNPLVSGWIYPTSGSSRTMDISTGENTSGNLSFFITTYDRACNFGQTSSEDLPAINLNKWVSTKGGVFYSEGSVNYATKIVYPDYFNLGTELISSNSNDIRDINNYRILPESNPAVAKGILDINNNSGQYAKLRENFETKKDSIKDAKIDGHKVTCEDPLGCKWETKTIEDITYSGKIIAYSDEGVDINIEEDIILQQNMTEEMDGMIVFSGGSITVTGETETNSELKFDTIDAWLLAKENVIIEPGTGPNSGPPHYYHDQVHVTGGIVAFGEGGSSPAFQLKRTLGLFNITDPVLIIDYHPKYSSISELFFGLHNPAYKREVGFKPM